MPRSRPHAVAPARNNRSSLESSIDEADPADSQCLKLQDTRSQGEAIASAVRTSDRRADRDR